MKKNKNLFFYLLGRFISFTGTGIQQIALPLYVLDTTGSGTLMGLLSVLSLVPTFIASPFAGVLGDRKNRKKIMILMDYGRGLLVCSLGILSAIGKTNIYSIFIAQVFISIMDSLFASSSAAIMPEFLKEEELFKAYSFRGSIDGVSQLIGPIIGAILYGIFGVKIVFFINGVSFIFSAICLTFVNYEKKTIQSSKITTRLFFTEAKEVLTFIKYHKGIMQLTTFACLANFLLVPVLDVIMPYVLKKKIGFTSQQFGYIVGFFTVGMIIGNLLINKLSKQFNNKTLMRLGFITCPIITIVGFIFLFPRVVNFLGGASLILFASIALCCSLLGASFAFVNTPIATNTQKLVPNELRSRYTSVANMLSMGAIPVGSLVFGTLIDKLSYSYLLIIISLLLIVVYSVFIINACEEVYNPVTASN